MSLVHHVGVTFTQTTGSGVYTASVVLEKGSTIIDIGAQALALWDGSSASLTIGIGAPALDVDAYFLATNLVATDLLAGETNNLEHQGGLGGVAIASEQRLLYSTVERTITFIVTQVGTGTLGRTRCFLTYSGPSVGQVAPAVKV